MWFSFWARDDEEGSRGSESSCGWSPRLCHHPGATLPHHRVCQVWRSPLLSKNHSETGAWNHYYRDSHSGIRYYPHLQLSNSDSKEATDKIYSNLGSVSPEQLISFAYQIASGMVLILSIIYYHTYSITCMHNFYTCDFYCDATQTTGCLHAFIGISLQSWNSAQRLSL